MSQKFLVGIAALLLMSSCSTDSGRRRGGSDASGGHAGTTITPQTLAQASAAEKKEYKDISQTFSESQWDLTLKKIAGFQKKFPKSALTPHVENLKGLVYLLSKHPGAAVPAFRKSIDLGMGLGAFPHFVRYNLASAWFDLEKQDEALNVINTIRLDQLDKSNRLKTLYLKAKIEVAQAHDLDATKDLLEASRSLNDIQATETSNSLRTLLDQSLQRLANYVDVEKLASDYEDAPVVDSVYYRAAQTARSAGQLDRTEYYVRELQRRFPQSPWFQSAVELLGPITTASSAGQSPVSTRNIGILLPLKGKFGKFGTRTLQAIELELNIFTPPGETNPGSEFQLIVEDSGDEPADAVRGLEKLVSVHHVGVVIGPLVGKGIEQVTVKAQELGVPIVSIARYDGAPGDFVFNAGLTLRLQAKQLAQYAVENMGFRRFAILHPRDKAGNQISNYFWDEVEKRGGSIQGIESYDPGETDFRIPIDKLGGTYYQDARKRELDVLAQAREEKKIKKRNRKTEQLYALPPIVEFDAVFLPDEPKVAGQIVPTFAYRDIDKIQFLGTSVWNSSEFLERVGADGNRTLFMDAFSSNTVDPALKSFMDRYRTTFSQDSTVLEAVAFDAARIVETALKRLGPQALRTEIRDNLKSIHNLAGVTGRLSYDEGLFSRNLKVMTIKNGQITELSSK